MRLPRAYRSLARPFIGARAEPFTKWHCSHVIDTICIYHTDPVFAWVSPRIEFYLKFCSWTLALTTTLRGEAGESHVRINDLHRIVRSVKWTYSDPSYSRFHGVVHLFAVTKIEHHRYSSFVDMDPLGFEPRASALQRQHSTTELWAHPSF